MSLFFFFAGGRVFLRQGVGTLSMRPTSPLRQVRKAAGEAGENFWDGR